MVSFRPPSGIDGKYGAKAGRLYAVRASCPDFRSPPRWDSRGMESDALKTDFVCASVARRAAQASPRAPKPASLDKVATSHENHQEVLSSGFIGDCPGVIPYYVSIISLSYCLGFLPLSFNHGKILDMVRGLKAGVEGSQQNHGARSSFSMCAAARFACVPFCRQRRSSKNSDDVFVTEILSRRLRAGSPSRSLRLPNRAPRTRSEWPHARRYHPRDPDLLRRVARRIECDVDLDMLDKLPTSRISRRRAIVA